MIDNVKVITLLLLILKPNGILTNTVRQSNEERIASLENCYKYLATIKRNEEVVCIGSLLASRWVLTGAHCCRKFSEYISDVKINFGVLVWKEINVISRVTDFIIHPDYNEDDTTNDICLIRLDSSIFETRTIKHVKLSQQQDMKNCDIAFMARLAKDRTTTSHARSRNVYCEKLKPARKPDCKGVYEQMNENLFCAKNAGTTISTNCVPDSGGPIMCNNNMQLGILSKSFGCTKSGYLNVYTKIDRLRPFINKAMNRTYNINDTTLNLKAPSNGNKMRSKAHLFLINIVFLLVIIYY